MNHRSVERVNIPRPRCERRSEPTLKDKFGPASDIRRGLIHPHPPAFHDPEPASERFGHERPGQCRQACLEDGGRCPLGYADHGDPREVGGRIDQRVGKINVKGHQGPPLATADFDQVPIVRCRQRLGRHRAHIMTGSCPRPPRFSSSLIFTTFRAECQRTALGPSRIHTQGRPECPPP